MKSLILRPGQYMEIDSIDTAKRVYTLLKNGGTSFGRSGDSTTFLAAAVADSFPQIWQYTKEFKGVTYLTDSSRFAEFTKNQTLIKEFTNMKVSLKNLQDLLRPYNRYILATIVLVLLDHFVFKGELSGKIRKLASSVADRCLKLLDDAIESVGGKSE